MAVLSNRKWAEGCALQLDANIEPMEYDRRVRLAATINRIVHGVLVNDCSVDAPTADQQAAHGVRTLETDATAERARMKQPGNGSVNAMLTQTWRRRGKSRFSACDSVDPKHDYRSSRDIMDFKKYTEAAKAILELTRRAETALPPGAGSEIRDLVKHGEAGLALEFLLDAMYDHEVAPSPEDTLRLIELGHFFEIPKHRLFFWPDPPPNLDDHGGNADPPRLLGGELEPLTHTVGFLNAPLAQVLHAMPRHQRGWFNRRIRTISTGGLRDLILALEPPNVLDTTHVLVTATAIPGWTALFDNTPAGEGVVPVAADLARRLRVRGYVVRSIPPWSQQHEMRGSRHFFVLGPEARTGILRRVATVERPAGSWTFDYHGEPQPFEDIARYDHAHQDERFTNDMLRAYAEAVGLAPWREDFYQPPGHIIPT